MCTAEGGQSKTILAKPAGVNPRQAMGMAAVFRAATEMGFLLGFQLDLHGCLQACHVQTGWAMTTKLQNAALYGWLNFTQ